MHPRVVCAVLALVLGGGCVTTATVVRGRERMSVPLIVGGIAADLVITAALTYQVQDFSAEAAVATSLTVTVVDTGVACIAGGCSALRP